MAKDRGQIKPVEPFVQLTTNSSTNVMITGFYTNQKVITTAGTPEQLPDKALPPGCLAMVKAKKSNTADITLGVDSTNSIFSSSTNLVIAAGDSHNFPVDNFDRIWMDASVSSEGVELSIVR